MPVGSNVTYSAEIVSIKSEDFEEPFDVVECFILEEDEVLTVHTAPNVFLIRDRVEIKISCIESPAGENLAQ